MFITDTCYTEHTI